MNMKERGIEVFYTNEKGTGTTVYFQDGHSQEYQPGEMLMELISDDSKYLLNIKGPNLVGLFPDRNNEITVENVEKFLDWINAAIDEDETPVADEIFKSNYTEIVRELIFDTERIADCENMGDFIDLCAILNRDIWAAYYDLFDALVHDASKLADIEQKETADDLKKIIEKYNPNFRKGCKITTESDIKKVRLRIRNPFILLIFEYCRMEKMRKAVKICHNCQRYFIPEARASAAIYCNGPSAPGSQKTCQEAGAQIKKAKAVQEHEFEKRHRNNLALLHRQIRKTLQSNAPDRDEYLAELYDDVENEKENFKQEKKENNIYGKKQKNEMKVQIGTAIDLNNGRFKDAEIDQLYDLVQNRDQYNGTSKTYKNRFTGWCNDGKYTREEERIYFSE